MIVQGLLTDFNSERWSGIDQEKLKKIVEDFNNKVKRIGVVYGELGRPNLDGELEQPQSFEISINNASHTITELSLKENKLYADIKFLNNNNGKIAQELIDSKKCTFGIRASGHTRDNKIEIEKIYTFDIIKKD